MLKRLMLLLLALLLCVGLFACKKEPEEPELPPTGYEGGEEEDPTRVAHGTFEGSAVTWSVHNDGTLYIAGTGVMPEFHDPILSPVTPQDSPQPWALYRAGSRAVIRRIVVKSGVTKLASRAFAYCPYVESVTLPASLTAIPESCFAFCTSLTSVRGGTGLVTVAESAFADCEKLAEIEVSTTLQTVEFGAFTGAATSDGGLTVLFAGGQTAWDAEKATLTVGASGNAAFLNAAAKDPAEE